MSKETLKVYLIGDRLTVTGLKLAGLKKAFIADEKNVNEVIKKIGSEANVILITSELAKLVVRDIEKLRKTGKIVIEIPDRSGSSDVIEKLIKDAIGFELKK